MNAVVAVIIWFIIISMIIRAIGRARRRAALRGPRVRPQVGYRQPMYPAPPLKRSPVSREMKAIVFRRDGGRCRHCGVSDAEATVLTGAHLQYDHIIPFSRGGPTAVGNLQLLCERCNQSKGNRYVG